MEIDPQFLAGRMSIRPPQLATLGAYQIGVITGEMAAGIAAAAEIFQFRFADATRLALITKVSLMGFNVSVTGFTAGIGHLSMQMARAWTANGTGGANPTLTTNNVNLRTDMPATLISSGSTAGDIRIATTAALTAGTKTLDAAFVGRQIVNFNTTAQQQMLPSEVPLFNWVDNNYHPIILEADEGFSILVTVPATGTWDAAIKVCWQEVSASDWA